VKTYSVGGSVRDELLGRSVSDRDHVVVGGSPEELLALGFKPVGRDFPVFLHPETHEEYALARTERKQGRGYHGFVFHAAPDVSLEEDLRRRDLTINAMAKAEDGSIIDPYGGRADLEARVLRHVSPAFAEDPLRVLRVARFAARFDFGVASETEALMRAIVAAGELETLAPERLWQELARALMEKKPSRFFAVLRRCGGLHALLPEVDALFGVPQPFAHHPEFDTGVHVMQAIDYAAAAGDALEVRYAVLAHDLGKATTFTTAWPRHIAHEQRGSRLADALSARLKVPSECRDLARIAARYHGIVHRALELRPATILDLLQDTDSLRRPQRLHALTRVCAADALSRPGRGGSAYLPERVLGEALAVAQSVRARDVLAPDLAPEAIARRMHAARVAALSTWKKGLAQEGAA